MQSPGRCKGCRNKSFQYLLLIYSFFSPKVKKDHKKEDEQNRDNTNADGDVPQGIQAVVFPSSHMLIHIKKTEPANPIKAHVLADRPRLCVPSSADCTRDSS